MTNSFFIGDAFMSHKGGLSQIEYSFCGAKQSKDSSDWEVNVFVTVANGYAGGASTLVWTVSENEEIRVSGRMKGYFITEGFNKQKIKENPIKALKFRSIKKDMVEIEFI